MQALQILIGVIGALLLARTIWLAFELLFAVKEAAEAFKAASEAEKAYWESTDASDEHDDADWWKKETEE